MVSNFKRALGYIISSGSLAFLLNFTKFFETETVTFCLDFTACHCGYHTKTFVRPTKLRLSQDYIMWYTTWTWVTITSLIPFFTLLVLNFIIWRRLSAAQRLIPVHSQASQVKHSQSVTDKTNLSSSTILLCTVATFLVCHFPRCSADTAILITFILI